jgi:RNA polymerase sigma factor (sigma-70 family)
MLTARRYSHTREDAEDAYQRGLEILLTKAPSTREADLVPWLKTVVKHEAFALRRQRERSGRPTAPDQLDTAAAGAAPHEHAERLERLQRGAEALARLKPQEIRCMLLLAEGHSYKQIQEITGFSYTKVNRCLSEGRRSFLERVARIESGEECRRLAPLVSALADGEASAADLTVLRPHLRTCLSCRAALRNAREVPARVAALAPIGLVAATGHGHAAGLRSAWDWLHERAAALAVRGQDVIEAATAHKVAAAAASAAALGSGGIATIEVTSSHSTHHPRHAAAARHWRPTAAVAPASPLVVPPATSWSPRRRATRRQRVHTRPQLTKPQPLQPAPQPASRVTPAPPAAPQHGARTAPPPATGEFGP